MISMAKSLQYTRDCARLTPSQRAFYAKNGYLLFPRLVPDDLLQKCRDRFHEIVAGNVPLNGMIVMRDVKDRKSVNKIQDFCFDEVLSQYIEYKGILDIAEAVTGPNIMAMHTMLIAKPPDIGYGTTKHPPHQDLYYFPFRPANSIVAAWTAMETCNNENGCLYVAPGSHLNEKLEPHDYPPGAKPGTVNKFYHGILDIPESTKFVELEMEAGDTVFFHPLLIHGSGINKSKRTRMAISSHYASADCNYVNVNNTVQQRIQDEIMDHVKDKYGVEDIDYADIWRVKSKIVRGVRSKL